LPDEAVTQAADALAESTARRVLPEALRWDWGEGLLLSALARQNAGYLPIVERFFAAHARRGLPRIDWSDKCSPALAALELASAGPNAVALDVCRRVVDYLRSSRATPAGGLNHFGTSLYSRFYPQSMWVDSLMMFGVFAARWGSFACDPRMTDFAADQALAFAGALQDPATGFWRHACFPSLGRAIPLGNAFWLRGNGWAIAAVATLLDTLPEHHPRRERLADILARSARGLLAHQRASGLWSTVIDRDTYLETSGSALCAWGLLLGARTGHLPTEARRAASAALQAVVARLEPGRGGLSMSSISASTMPYPTRMYGWIPRRRDLPHGIAAFLFAAQELARGSSGDR
jgi:unsaturated rhamnogalacturonyl hydrolase